MLRFEDQSIWVMDGSVHRLLKYDRNGQLQYHWGTYGEAGAIGRSWAGGLSLSHRIKVDEEGTLYIANYNGRAVDKYVPKPTADHSKLVGQPLLLRD